MRSRCSAQQVDDVEPRRAPRRGRGRPAPASPRGTGAAASAGATSVDLGAEGGEGGHVRAGHPAVLDVADDGDRGRPSRRAAARWSDRVAVEQRLGGVLVPPVAGVDHRRASHPAGDLPRHARRGVAHHDRVDAHRLDGLDRVAQGLALLDRRARHAEGHGVGREALGRRLEAEPGAGRVLEEERHDGLAPQRRAPSGWPGRSPRRSCR